MCEAPITGVYGASRPLMTSLGPLGLAIPDAETPLGSPVTSQ